MVPDAPAWFDDLASLYAFERDARRELGGLRRREARDPRRLVYDLVLDVPFYDEPRRIRIEFAAAGGAPSVYLDGPNDSPHRYHDGSLCMYHAADPPGHRWLVADGFAALIDYIRTHLFQEAEARSGHGWPGDEAPHVRARNERARR
jgi:hypothetical protein